MPQGGGATLCIHTQRAWQAKYLKRVTPGYKSKTVTWDEKCSYMTALLKVLKWTWKRHHERVPAAEDPCPVDFGDLSDSEDNGGNGAP